MRRSYTGLRHRLTFAEYLPAGRFAPMEIVAIPACYTGNDPGRFGFGMPNLRGSEELKTSK